MMDIEKDVCGWYFTVFPKLMVDELEEEFIEKRGKFEGKISDHLAFFTEDAAIEFADMVIVYMRGLKQAGMPSLTQIIYSKIEKQR